MKLLSIPEVMQDASRIKRSNKSKKEFSPGQHLSASIGATGPHLSNPIITPPFIHFLVLLKKEFQFTFDTKGKNGKGNYKDEITVFAATCKKNKKQ
jgi:hypothetical protein